MSATPRYHPIDLCSLVEETSPDFSLYLHVDDHEFVLFRDRDLPFHEHHRLRLIDNQVTWLYVSEEDQRSYGRYVEHHIGTLMSTPGIPEVKQAGLLYSVAKGVLRDAFEDPRAKDVVRRTEHVTTHAVEFVLKSRQALHHLITMMSHDYYTFTHSMNVSMLSVALASQAGVKEKRELDDLATGTMLHDIGKTEIPKTLLTKGGPLTEDEMRTMREHVLRGERILAEQGAMNATRMLAVSLHHEKLNGGGYPRGLSQEQLHMFGRITAIADCFDAMTTRRSYQHAMRAFDALSIMRGRLREHFDQDLLETFIKLLAPPN